MPLFACFPTYAEYFVQVDALGNDRTIIPDDWASIMYQELRQFRGNMMPLTDLASLYLSHLIIACKMLFPSSLMTGILSVPVRNPGGKKTPQDSIYTTPHPKRIEDIDALLKSVTVRQSQSALRDVVCSDRPLATINSALSYHR
jgi:hypothetical protein